ncbi:hypothetical protein ABZ468_37175 [Streptomyces sp. NPDC005708]|uniref:hypothetical protein n=1 Tax=Streptomyces sp. NPDC005708 TaxID=3154564 RepID=UPI003400B3D0
MTGAAQSARRLGCGADDPVQPFAEQDALTSGGVLGAVAEQCFERGGVDSCLLAESPDSWALAVGTASRTLSDRPS